MDSSLSPTLRTQPVTFAFFRPLYIICMKGHRNDRFMVDAIGEAGEPGGVGADQML
jgi:hypothetical protein